MKNYIKDYPRPQMIRKDWALLDGKWDFAFDDANIGEASDWKNGLPEAKKITVPFSYETKLSGIGDEKVHNHVWYARKINVESKNKRVLLHFEGCDYRSRVFVNGNLAGEHLGGYARFSFDVTELVTEGENLIVVHAEDSLSRSQPRGKQRWLKDNFACWYVQTTGIWKSVWMEYVPEAHITSLKLTPSMAERSIIIEAGISKADGLQLFAAASFDGTEVGYAMQEVKEGKVKFSVNVNNTDMDEWGIKSWTPENPNLYDLQLSLMRGTELCDTVLSYFGMREISIKGDRVLLNGYPFYQKLILDQGYWKDSHLTPPDEAALIEDIDKVQQLGYNGVRKHQKTEDERFLYWCDVKGLLVWSEFPATYSYTDEAVENISREWTEIVKQNYSHPCIITWTPFNESWGVPDIATDSKQQSFTESIYKLTKSIDSMRPVICNDGWRHTISDIITLHDYVESGDEFYASYSKNKDALLNNEEPFNSREYAFAEGYGYKGQPVIISEFGGIAFDNDDSGWGYGNKIETEDAFLARFASITGAIKKLDYCCGYCYTQVSDVQQEINGLMDMERNFKVSPEAIAKINKE